MHGINAMSWWVVQGLSHAWVNVSFAVYRLDISDEFKQVISTLKGHDDKVRGCLMNLSGCQPSVAANLCTHRCLEGMQMTGACLYQCLFVIGMLDQAQACL